MLTAILTALVGAVLGAVVAHFWPQIMSWAREHVLPGVDRNFPELAESVRLGFQDLDPAAVALRRAVRAAWRRLREVLVSQTAEFVAPLNGEWAVRITSCLRAPEEGGEPLVTVVTERGLRWEELPADVRAAAMSNGIIGATIDIAKARDQLLSQTV